MDSKAFDAYDQQRARVSLKSKSTPYHDTLTNDDNSFEFKIMKP